MEKVNKIISLLENGQHDEALRQYESILLNGSHEERFVLGEELLHFGFLEEAKSLFKRLLESYPEEGELLVLLAETHIDLGEEDEAILVLEQVKAEDPSFPQSLLLLADLYQLEGLYEVSEQKLLKAKAILPNEVIIDFAMGELYAEQGRFMEAARVYLKVLETDEIIAGVNVNQRMAEVLSVGGSFEEALPYYEKAMEDKLEINTLFSYAFTALQAGYNRTAIEKFNELKELDPEYNSLYINLAKAYEREEELENSLNTIKAGMKYDEYNKELFYFGGTISLKLGQDTEAENFLREALALDPEFIEAALALTKLFLHQERFEDVLEITSLLSDFGEEEPRLLWDAAIANQNLEEYSLALNKYSNAYTFFKEEPEFLLDYGNFLIEEGKTDEAAEIFSKLVKLEPGIMEYQDILQRLLD
ncbi:lipopolysaccharide assembly protein LapB [Bacillus sp. S/N-304-OC-R1]|uniref:tetratricopeptide repeat protein n=1 Tax=Bacillus sp. S/N-304-OC-R1 TaxID=2758034 RepID=UPI001C8E7CD6|nr:tetratricopeptide repeat protein [Bacillus sp. S/N-304-OC-R1]MBY0122597.1 tetratricopeptide repeat protein [Bacillus sp. S/N-304-OC-R1]